MIVGTAGHIDHGKTTLVRALTGVDTDRLPEEQRRGITIELGFASGAAAVCEISRGERPRSASYLELTVAGTEGVLSREWDAEGVLAWTDAGLAAWGVTG